MKLSLENFPHIVDSKTEGEILKADCPYRQERHRERELMLAIEGNVDFTMNGKMFKAVPGTAFFIDSWVPHKQYYSIKDINCAHYWIHLHDRRLFGGLLHIGDKGIHEYEPTVEFSQELTSLIRQRWQYLERNDIHETTRKRLEQSILTIMFDDMEVQPFLSGIASNQAINVVESVQRCILMNHGRIFPREELEHICGYTEHHLMRIFKQQTGQTIGEYTNHVRRDFVASAMEKGLTQKEIAEQLGFSSASAFWLWRSRMNKKK